MDHMDDKHDMDDMHGQDHSDPGRIPQATTTTTTTPTATTTRPPAVWPTLQAHDADAMIAFLTRVLGFVENTCYRDGDTVTHAQLDWPEGGGIMLGTYRPGRAWTLTPGTAGTYLVTDRLEAVEAAAREAGAEVVTPVQDTDYGSRELTVRDPEGNLWSLGTYAGEPRDVPSEDGDPLP